MPTNVALAPEARLAELRQGLAVLRTHLEAVQDPVERKSLQKEYHKYV
jgi:hypothetical protein